MDKIIIDNLLPDVFRGAEKEPPVSLSELWLRHIVFEKGNTYLIVAESGTGKSSLCSYIYGNRSDYQGRILFDGDDIRGFDIARWCQIRRSSLALLPQEMRLFPELTAMENIMLKNNLSGHKTREEIAEMMRRLEIADKIDSPVAILSIGQQQRVAIIRALCQPFDFLILDEPVSHLDSRNNATVAALAVEEAKAQGAAIIATSVGNHLSINPDFTINL
ncbi:MAG: ATP-binding cassette domain-containing protein [Muribaculaceae bacterium]|nr:ATP-binding cassette domain-containing protein [Muribaculaceae bacterium]